MQSDTLHSNKVVAKRQIGNQIPTLQIEQVMLLSALTLGVFRDISIVSKINYGRLVGVEPTPPYAKHQRAPNTPTGDKLVECVRK